MIEEITDRERPQRQYGSDIEGITDSEHRRTQYGSRDREITNEVDFKTASVSKQGAFTAGCKRNPVPIQYCFRGEAGTWGLPGPVQTNT